MPLTVDTIRNLTVTGNESLVFNESGGLKSVSDFSIGDARPKNDETLRAIRDAISIDPRFASKVDVQAEATRLLNQVRTDRAIGAAQIKDIVQHLDSLAQKTEAVVKERVTAHLAAAMPKWANESHRDKFLAAAQKYVLAHSDGKEVVTPLNEFLLHVGMASSLLTSEEERGTFFSNLDKSIVTITHPETGKEFSRLQLPIPTIRNAGDLKAYLNGMAEEAKDTTDWAVRGEVRELGEEDAREIPVGDAASKQCKSYNFEGLVFRSTDLQRGFHDERGLVSVNPLTMQDARDRLAQAESEVARFESEVAQAEAEFNHAQAEAEQAETEVSQFESEVKKAKDELEKAKDDWAKLSKAKSKFDGAKTRLDGAEAKLNGAWERGAQALRRKDDAEHALSCAKGKVDAARKASEKVTKEDCDKNQLEAMGFGEAFGATGKSGLSCCDQWTGSLQYAGGAYPDGSPCPSRMYIIDTRKLDPDQRAYYMPDAVLRNGLQNTDQTGGEVNITRVPLKAIVGWVEISSPDDIRKFEACAKNRQEYANAFQAVLDREGSVHFNDAYGKEPPKTEEQARGLSPSKA